MGCALCNSADYKKYIQNTSRLCIVIINFLRSNYLKFQKTCDFSNIVLAYISARDLPKLLGCLTG